MYLSASNIIEIIYIALAVFSALLLTDRNYGSLQAICVFLVVLAIFNFLEEIGITRDIYLITPSFLFAIGPLYYLFVCSVVYGKTPSGTRYFKHLTPALLSLLFTLWPQYVLIAGSISQVVYTFLCYRLIQRYHTASENMCSDADDVNLRWLSRVMIAIVSVTFIDIGRHNLQAFLPLELAHVWYLSMQLCHLGIFVYLINCAIKQPSLFTGVKDFEKTQPVAERLTLGAASSTLILKTAQSDADILLAKHIFDELNQLIIAQSMYRQPRLSLRDLSSQSGVNEKDISWAINTTLHINFNDYINQFRVEEVKRGLLAAQSVNDRSQNILELAINAGFNSKSSFNAVFKRLEGMTPSQYSRSCLTNPL